MAWLLPLLPFAAFIPEAVEFAAIGSAELVGAGSMAVGAESATAGTAIGESGFSALEYFGLDGSSFSIATTKGEFRETLMWKMGRNRTPEDTQHLSHSAIPGYILGALGSIPFIGGILASIFTNLDKRNDYHGVPELGPLISMEAGAHQISSLIARSESPMDWGQADIHVYHWQPGTSEVAQSLADAQAKLERVRLKHDSADWNTVDEFDESKEGKYLALVLAGGVASDMQIFAATQALMDNHGAVFAATRDLIGLGLFPITADDAIKRLRDAPRDLVQDTSEDTVKDTVKDTPTLESRDVLSSYDAAFSGLKRVFASIKSGKTIDVPSLVEISKDVVSVIPGDIEYHAMLKTVATGELDLAARQALGLGSLGYFQPTGMTAVVTAVWPVHDANGRRMGKKHSRSAGQRKPYPAIMMLNDTKLDDRKLAQLRVSEISLPIDNHRPARGLHMKTNRKGIKFNKQGGASGCVDIPLEGLDEPVEGCYIMVDDAKADKYEVAVFRFLGAAILNRNERRLHENLPWF